MDYRKLTRQNFKLEMLLGLGKSSQVYLAHAPDGREVALKVPRREVREDKNMAASFAQEVALLLTLNHKNIIRAFSGRGEGEGAFLALEYMVDGTLDERLHKGRLATEFAVDCLLQIAEALVFLHDKGIIHQDVKPSNIFLDGMMFKLADFGVAKTRENPRPLERAGSPYYMAPELHLGEETTPATDAYSLGIMSYELLMGVRPFRGETFEEVSFAHVHTTLSATGLEPYLDRVVKGLLIKDPKKRMTILEAMRILKKLPEPDLPRSSTSVAQKPKGLFGAFRKK